jgi:hypothetical protein
MLAIEILRAMVRGDDSEGRVQRSLAKVVDHLGKSSSPQHEIISKAVEDLNQHLSPKHDRSSLAVHIDRIVTTSLRVAAEQCCEDNAAAGRRSGRVNDLFSAIDGFNRWYDRPPRR